MDESNIRKDMVSNGMIVKDLLTPEEKKSIKKECLVIYNTKE